MLIVPSPAEAGAGDGASLGDQVPQPGDASVDRLPAAGDRYRVLRLVRVRVALTPIAARLTCLPRALNDDRSGHHALVDLHTGDVRVTPRCDLGAERGAGQEARLNHERARLGSDDHLPTRADDDDLHP